MRAIVLLVALVVTFTTAAAETACQKAEMDFWTHMGISMPDDALDFTFLNEHPSCKEAKVYGNWLRGRIQNQQEIFQVCSQEVIKEIDTRGVEQNIRSRQELDKFWAPALEDQEIDEQRYCSGHFERISTERSQNCNKLADYFEKSANPSMYGETKPIPHQEINRMVDACNAGSKQLCLNARVKIHLAKQKVPSALTCQAAKAELGYPKVR